MSRIGKMPVPIEGATVSLDGKLIAVKGPKGELALPIPGGLSVTMEGNHVVVSRKGEERALHGLFRAQLHNAVVGVTKLWTKELELSGVGFRAAMNGTNLVLTVGFSHPVPIAPPAGITIAVVEGKIVVSGIDKQLVGEVAAGIRAVKKPEPYKGKGIKYVGERIRRKAGKSAKAVGGAPGGGGAK